MIDSDEHILFLSENNHSINFEKSKSCKFNTINEEIYRNWKNH
jgi:hypothetical protein